VSNNALKQIFDALLNRFYGLAGNGFPVEPINAFVMQGDKMSAQKSPKV
jgi:chitinase